MSSSSVSDTGTSLSMKPLTEIATNVCIRQIHKIDDVGLIPYRLLQPILRRMNAKQLSRIEEFSPQVQPESDEIWRDLVQKEFPNRPPDPTKFDVYMPYRTLFERYSEERAAMRSDSAARLRDINARLKKEKSKNSIVAVSQMIRDPTVRRRSGYFGGGNNSNSYTSIPGNKNSMLYKARKELRHRLLMFPKKRDDSIHPRQRHPSSRQMAYNNLGSIKTSPVANPKSNLGYSRADRVSDSRITVPYPSVAPRYGQTNAYQPQLWPPTRTTISKSQPISKLDPPSSKGNETGSIQHTANTTTAGNMITNNTATNTATNTAADVSTNSGSNNADSAVAINSTTATNACVPQVTVAHVTDTLETLPKQILAPRKRRPETSIFLTKRRQLPPSAYTKSMPKKSDTSQSSSGTLEPTSQESSPIKKIKSSIFS